MVMNKGILETKIEQELSLMYTVAGSWKCKCKFCKSEMGPDVAIFKLVLVWKKMMICLSSL